MNKYGHQAMKHWQETDPTRYAAIPNPMEFFSTLGDQVLAQVTEVSDKLAGSDPPNEQYMVKVARLNTARMQAEELVLTDLVWILEPEQDEAPSPFAEINERHQRWEDEEAMKALDEQA